VAWPSGKAEACKASIPQFESGCHLTFYLSHMLYVVATPIGNLSDITFRAVETLKSCDYILCEDTRHSSMLLHHYAIKKLLKSFHKFNEAARQEEIIADLKKGLSICLISDAGTPGISDPGEKLIHMCLERGITVTAIPGPSAIITALCSSGLNTSRFQFMGFLPRKAGELKRCLKDALAYPGTTICYESPNRLLDALEQVKELDPIRTLVVARELTKKFEEVKRGNAEDLTAYWKNNLVRGEIVLMISETKEVLSHDWESLTPLQHVELSMQTYRMTRQEAILHVAKLRGVSKRDIYNTVNK
jgi:16S rRNA (cytidine1402-2'-O)-methyltransferase